VVVPLPTIESDADSIVHCIPALFEIASHAKHVKRNPNATTSEGNVSVIGPFAESVDAQLGADPCPPNQKESPKETASSSTVALENPTPSDVKGEDVPAATSSKLAIEFGPVADAKLVKSVYTIVPPNAGSPHTKRMAILHADFIFAPATDFLLGLERN
jgi:hypothetical protein